MARITEIKIGQLIKTYPESDLLYIVASHFENGLSKLISIGDHAGYGTIVTLRDYDEAVVVSEEWPNNGIAFNRWYTHFDLFQKVLEISKFNWVSNSRFKYVNYRVDTRTNAFRMYDRDEVEATPIEMLNPLV